MKLVFGKWYVVRVSFRPGNPTHTAICSWARDGKKKDSYHVVLHGCYEDDVIKTDTSDLHHFEVIREIPEMGV